MPFQGSFPKHTVYYSVGWKWLSTVVVLKFFSEAFSISLLFNEKALGRLIKSQIHPTCEFKLTYYKLCTDFPRKYPSKNLLAAMWPPKFVRKWIRVRKQQQQLIKKKKKTLCKMFTNYTFHYSAVSAKSFQIQGTQSFWPFVFEAGSPSRVQPWILLPQPPKCWDYNVCHHAKQPLTFKDFTV